MKTADAGRSVSETRHFRTLLDLDDRELRELVERATELKAMYRRGETYTPLVGRTLGMIFEKSSTRTRVSFEVAMAHFGGSAIFLSPRDSQLGRGEPVADTARVISRMVDSVMIRTFGHDTLSLFASHSRVPVINGLTDLHHPLQLLADMQTWTEQRGEIRGKTAAWIGDGNNMCHSYVHAARQFDFRLRISTPSDYRPLATIVAEGGSNVEIVDDPAEAARDADLICTDVWASMGQEDEQARRNQAFAAYQVNDVVMSQGRPDALFMHCLPAHRGEEVSASVIDGEHSVVWDQAENRLHSQKALLEFLLCRGEVVGSR